jgi:release factor glutamine methyltransferase
MFATLEHKDTDLVSMSNTNDKKDFTFLQRALKDRLQSLYDEGEISAITKEVARVIWGQPLLEIITGKLCLDDEQLTLLDSQITRLGAGEPLQYVLGFAYFAGRQFRVNKSVLIPRPETEELAMMVVEDILPGHRPTVLDIGCGSGCIISTIALENKLTKCCAIDISEGALNIAKENAKDLGADVAFFEADILRADFDFEKVNIIVSNPPYIPQHRKEEMHLNVLNYEPHVALFVEDDDAFLFYRRIAEIGRKILNDGGRIYFETHVDGAKEVAQVLEGLGYEEVRILRDMNGHERFVCGRLNSEK